MLIDPVTVKRMKAMGETHLLFSALIPLDDIDEGLPESSNNWPQQTLYLTDFLKQDNFKKLKSAVKVGEMMAVAMMRGLKVQQEKEKGDSPLGSGKEVR